MGGSKKRRTRAKIWKKTTNAIVEAASAKLTKNKRNAQRTCALNELAPSGKENSESSAKFSPASSGARATAATAKRLCTSVMSPSARVIRTVTTRTTRRIAIGVAAIVAKTKS